MMIHEERIMRRPKISPAAQYELDIINGAESFSTYQHGYREAWKVTGFKTLDAAKLAASNWAEHARTVNNSRPILIYAIKSGHQALVGQLEVNGKWKEAIRK